MKSMEKIMSWFDFHNSFDLTMEALPSLSTGLTASDDDKINCDDAENVGIQIQKKLDGLCFKEISMKRNDQIRSSASLQDGMKVDNEKVQINPSVLFGCLTALAQ